MYIGFCTKSKLLGRGAEEAGLGRGGGGAEVNLFDDDVVALIIESNFNTELAADRNWSLVKILGEGRRSTFLMIILLHELLRANLISH